MSATTTITVMQEDKRGDASSRKNISARLPAIAPKDDQTSSTSSSRSGRQVTTITPRARLPPRSRTGCWTCRTRKVKCDEGRPVCGQCARLGHTCDYNPRLSFRDDTLRVVERMQDVTVAGSAVWDRQSSAIGANRRNTDSAAGNASPTPSSVGSGIDDLPPFASLLTDEDRERKAEVSSPGTYNVVVNPESFQHLPEYAEDLDGKRDSIATLRRGSIATSLASSIGRESLVEAIPIPGDPNTVVLPRFEDLSRRSTREIQSPISPSNRSRPSFKREESESGSFLRSTESTILQHFRDGVWQQLVPPEHGKDASIALLEEAAVQFPPLARAMMAVSALALVQQDGRERFDALQHYSQVLPELQNSLKSEEDLASDGAFLTHFLMLVYEIAAADVEHPNIWPHHIQTLLKITLLRRRIFGAERFPFIVWWVCNIDLDALLSGTGKGDFVGYMLKNDLIPPPSFHLHPLGVDGLSVIYAEERETLPAILQLDYEVTLLAVRLAALAQEFRQDSSFNSVDSRQRAMNIKLRQSQVFDLQESLRQLWMVPPVRDLALMQLPVRAQWLFHHAWSLYRACIIYSHTSMWPGQRLETSPNCDSEIAVAVNQILQISNNLDPIDGCNSRFLVFPLFMAGFASFDGNQKMVVLDLIQQLEQTGLGRNAISARKALELVYERQNEQFMHTGHSLDVDWMQVMTDSGLTVVSFGM